MKILCFYTNDEVRERFKGEFDDLVFFEGTTQNLQDQDFENFKDVEIITSFISSIFSPEILKKFPNLKLIATRSTGVDNIDKDYCEQQGIEIKNVPDYGSNTVAEHAFALLLALSRKVFYSYRRVAEDMDFSRMGMADIRGFDLAGKTLGIIGTGKIGKNVAEIAHGFDMKVLVNDIHPDQDWAKKINATYVSQEELFVQSDVISLNVPLCDETHHLIGAEEIGKMKEGVVLINTARGEIIDTPALYEALLSGKVAAAGLDVLEHEQCFGREGSENNVCDEEIKKLNKKLIDRHDVIVTPHNAFNTTEALERIYQTTITNIKEFIK